VKKLIKLGTRAPRPPVYPFFHMELGPTGQIFIKFDVLVFFENLFSKSSFLKIWQ
jgi:hypothetical protein